MDRKDAFEQANAFVDGELDRDGRNDVLARAAKDPHAAQELADLSRLKSVLEDAVDVPNLDLTSMTGKARSRTQWRRTLGVAASLLLAFLTGTAWWWGTSPSSTSDGLPGAWAVTAHQSWQEAPSKKTLLRPAGIKLDAHIPDLAAAQLRIAHVGEIKAPDGAPALVVGYKGTRGCRVTLIVDAAPRGLKGAPVFVQTEALQAMVWRVGALRHQILAEGMDGERFRKIAETVRRSTLDRLPLSEETRMALARSRAKSVPCAA
jgi:anti-sigma factor RsiW